MLSCIYCENFYSVSFTRFAFLWHFRKFCLAVMKIVTFHRVQCVVGKSNLLTQSRIHQKNTGRGDKNPCPGLITDSNIFSQLFTIKYHDKMFFKLKMHLKLSKDLSAPSMV